VTQRVEPAMGVIFETLLVEVHAVMAVFRA
jgi:hypothetical protein